MAAVIVVGSLVLAAAYVLLWWTRPDLRRRIEAPGQRFAADATRYDRTTSAGGNFEEQEHGHGQIDR